ncbi:hypothetical protein QAD02_007628 [Eretmocerus hayati]|uniref:Uncharacterized protein n=1 Tax=Eretmocerus hayati TaxID=131215 RepID=A0ACC2N5I9_9HYME|nr:hypothetical protein QAD02_007628 [Eretmocerus hayati]
MVRTLEKGRQATCASKPIFQETRRQIEGYLDDLKNDELTGIMVVNLIANLGSGMISTFDVLESEEDDSCGESVISDVSTDDDTFLKNDIRDLDEWANDHGLVPNGRDQAESLQGEELIGTSSPIAHNSNSESLHAEAECVPILNEGADSSRNEASHEVSFEHGREYVEEGQAAIDTADVDGKDLPMMEQEQGDIAAASTSVSEPSREERKTVQRDELGTPHGNLTSRPRRTPKPKIFEDYIIPTKRRKMS